MNGFQGRVHEIALRMWNATLMRHDERVSPDNPNLSFYGHLETYRFVSQFVRDAQVLDVGCGTGYGCHHLLGEGARRVDGIDYSRKAIRYARSHYADPRLTYHEMNAEKLDFPDNHFDVVSSLENLEHLPHPERCLAEVRRVLRPDGLLVLGTPNKEISSPGLRCGINPFHLIEFDYDMLDALLHQHFAEVTLFEPFLEGGPHSKALKAERRRRQRIGIETMGDVTISVGPRQVALKHRQNSHSFLALAWGQKS